MAIDSVVVAITVVIATMVSEEIVKYIGQWLIENMVKPVGQLLIEKLVKPIGQWLGYLFDYSSNIENMKEQVKKLRDLRERVPLPHSVDAATRNIEEIETDVNKWLENADLIMREAKQVIEDEEKSKMRCSYAICLNLKQRHQQSKKAKKIVQDINEVLKNWRSNKVFHMDFMNFGSRMVKVKELMVALGDANFNMIGVWGMPGVGKTTLVREVAKQVKEEKLFDEVAIATVTQSPDPIKIQGEIADKLDLKLDKETPSGRADLLRATLTKDNNKKILVILDDIWKKLDLDEIGIPRTGCKVVLTSRNKDVLSSEMGTQLDFGLEVLLKEEAWCLFKKLSGDSLRDLKLLPIAFDVSNACAGLPLALVTVAKALKNKSLFYWEDALWQLRRPAPRNQRRMQEVIYSAIKLSYNHLENPELKSFFLFCAQNLVFSYILNQDLLKKCFGLRKFHGISTLEGARNRMYTLVRILQNSGLLLDAPDTRQYFCMHDLTRDVALLIAYETQNVLTMRDEGLVEWPDEDDMKMCTSISVFNKDIHELPDKLECPELRCLYVYAKDREGPFKISDTFFEGMRKLKVLDLTYMRLSSLSSSLKLLTNLRTLCLDQCVLGDIAMIGEMKNLEILSLIRSEFEQLPREIGLLTHLRMLDLSNCKKLQVIPANVLSRLTHLEELYVGNSFTQWEVKGLNNERASLAELKDLSQLSTLEVHIPDANMIPKDLLFEKLKRYKIFIGDVWDWSDKHENSTVLKLKLNTCNQLESGIEMLFNGIEDLYLDELNGVKSIVYELDMKGFQQLKHLHVQNNAKIKYIIHSRGLVIDDVVFPALKIFSLKNMINLEGICDAQLPLTSFRDIRIMKVEQCEKLKFVFSSSIAKGLSQLQELEIKECNIMRAIVVKEDGELEDRDMILFPQLRHLKLQCLPRLMSFSSTQNSIITDVGEIVHEGELDFQEIPLTGMQPLFNEEVAFPNLESLIISHMPNLKIIWHEKFAPSSFTKLQLMNVQFCESLMNIFQVNMLSRFQSLESLVVDDCDSLQEIFELEGQEVAETRAVTVIQLKKLFMRRLPKLKRVWNKDPHGTFSFQNLQQIEVVGCESLMTLFPTSVARCLKQLDDLRIVECGIEEIIEQEEGAKEDARFVFPKLTLLILRKLSKLKWFYRGVHTSEWPLLKTLEVSGSNEIQIFTSKNYRIQEQDEQSQQETSIQQPLFFVEEVAFPNLESLIISHMPNLKIIWHEKFAPSSFTKLQLMNVQFCESLMNIFQVNMLSRFQSLESLVVDDCDSLQEIFELEGQEVAETRAVTVIQLKKLFMRRLPKLKRVWNKDPHGTFSFQNLQQIEVVGCESLMTLFPTSVARCLKQLDDLRIVECGIEELIEQEEGAKEDARFVFPKLTLLILRKLSKLKWFYRGVHTSEWPLLKTLEVSGSNEIQIFTSKNYRIQEQDEQSQQETSIQQPLFFVEEEMNSEETSHTAVQPLFNEEVAFPSLETLTIMHMENLKIIWHDQLAEDSFFKLQSLTVKYCENLVNIFESNLLTRFQSLERLKVCYCGSLHELFELQRHNVRESHAVTTIPLKRLILRCLPKMKQVWNEDPQGIFSFQNLQVISVRKCESLQSLFPASVARCLMQLEDLRIVDCGVEEIVSREEIAEAASRFFFPKVTLLILRKLPKLKWFYREVHTSEWPLLKTLEVSRSDKIQIFASKKFRIEEPDEQSLSETSIQQSLFLVEEVAFPSLETLRLDQCVLEDIAMIGELRNLEILSLLHSNVRQLPGETGLLTRLRILNVSNCTKLKVIPPNVLSCLIQLEELYVGNSFTQWEVEGLNNERASLAELKHLSRLTTLEVHIPDANMLPKDLLFEKLQRYKIFVGDVWDWSDKHENSRALKHKLNTSFHLERGIKMLLNGIENLCLDELKGVKSVIYELDMTGFQQLKHLHVQNNVEIKYIIDSRGILISNVVFPVLEVLSLKNMINLEEICHGQIPLKSFGNLSIVKVEHCEKLKFIFSSSIAKSLSQLQTLEIRECSIMGAIAEKEEGRTEDRDMILFPQLRHLVLHGLPKLMSFLSTQNSDIIDAGEVIPESEQVVFPNLETSELSSIHSEEILLHNQHRPSSSFKLTDPRFQNLRDLNVKGTGNLKYLLSSSTATFMVQLKYLYIEDCKVMEEVLLTEDLGEEEIIPKVLFPQLEVLFLKDLPVLKRFCIGSNIRFPSLTGMKIEQCPKLESFIFKPVSSGMTLSKELEEVNSEEISHTAMQPLFNEKVAFPSLETLKIKHMENLKIIWHDQFAEDSFFKLQSLFVKYCENLVNIFESNMLTRFQSLERLEVAYCGSLQEVFELQRHDVRESQVVTAIPLKRLILFHLPKMKQVWNKDPQGIFCFQNLQEIEVLYCESLPSLFPASVARCLMQLENLGIGSCGVEEIVAREDDAEAAERFVFPKVTLLRLGKLPKLKWFCRGVHTSEWPLLKELWVRACDQIEIFASKILNFQETVEQSQLETSIQQPLFLVEEGTLFPNLEVLALGGKFNMKEILRDQLFEECLYKLKVLHVIDYVAVSVWITFLKRLHNLEKLIVRSSSWEEIFPYKELFDMENHATILARLRELELFELPMLTHLWKEDTQPSPMFHNLENLKVSICDKLKNLVPSSVSFQNLTILEICKCHGLINLVTSSTAKSLVQLKKMSVSECESITEVITREGGEASEVITFTRLTYLKLDCLPNLSSFCSESYSFEFPSLEEVIVRQCPEMKTFSHGALGTPKLERVQATEEDEWHWKANLNTTIHWLWESKYNTTTQ